MKIIKLNEDDQAQLYCQYPSQNNPQDVYMELDPETTPPELSIDYNGVVGSGVPMDVWNNRRRRYYLHGIPTAASANALLDHLAPLAERVAAGYDTKYDGNNYIGTLNEDGQDAENEIESYLDCQYYDEDGGVGVMNAGDWLRDADPETEGVTADSTDKDLERIAEEIEGAAEGEGIHVLEGIADVLDKWRDDLKEEAVAE